MIIKNKEGADRLEGLLLVLVKLGFIDGVYVEEEHSMEDWGIYHSGQSWIVTIINKGGVGKINVLSSYYKD